MFRLHVVGARPDAADVGRAAAGADIGVAVIHAEQIRTALARRDVGQLVPVVVALRDDGAAAQSPARDLPGGIGGDAAQNGARRGVVGDRVDAVPSGVSR